MGKKFISEQRCVFHSIPVTLIRKKIKHMYISVKAPDGHVVISAPCKINEEQIAQFVLLRQDWILRKQEECRRKAPQKPAGHNERQQYEKGETVLLWGEHYILEQDVPQIKEWHRAILKEKIAQTLPFWEACTGLHCDSWHVKDMKTRWGSCNTKAKQIWLNLKLVKYAPECLDYVILHELLHLQVANHGAAFIQLLDTYMPDWREREKQLQKTL